LYHTLEVGSPACAEAANGSVNVGTTLPANPEGVNGAEEGADEIEMEGESK
jgi:hypothetical protein